MPNTRINYSGDLVLTNNKVGIATTNPQATLDVVGDVRVGFGTTNSQAALSVNGNVGIVGIATATSFSGDIYNSYPFYVGITSSVYASPTGVLAPVIAFSTSANRRYIIHSINVANKARMQPMGAGATVGISSTTGAVTSLNIVSAGAGYTSGDVFVSMGTTDVFNRIQGLIGIGTTSFVGVGTTGDSASIGITSAIGIVTSVSGGQITGIALTFNGFGYTSPPSLTFQSPVGIATTTVGMTTATGTTSLTYGEVVAAYLNTPGESYTIPPSVSIASTTGIGALITSEVDSNGRVIRLNLINRGYGYSTFNSLGNDEQSEVYITLPGLAKTEVAVDVAIDRYSTGTGTTIQSFLAYNTPVPVGGVVEILKQPAVLNPGDQIEIRGVDIFGSGLSNAIDVCLSYEETNNLDYIGYGTVTGANIGLGTAITNIGILSATTLPIMLRSIRLTNTEFVGDYDASIMVVLPNSITYNSTINSTVSSGSTIIFVDNLTNNSLETVVVPGNLITLVTGVGIALTNASIVSVGNTFVTIGVGSTVPSSIGIGSTAIFTINRTTYLARNLMIPAFASIELCDVPKRIEPRNILMMNAETVGIDSNFTQTIDIQVSGKTIRI